MELNDNTDKESDNNNNTNNIAQLDKSKSLIDQLKMVMGKNYVFEEF
jgi:hypothetical protein